MTDWSLIHGSGVINMSQTKYEIFVELKNLFHIENRMSTYTVDRFFTVLEDNLSKKDLLTLLNDFKQVIKELR